MVNAYLLEMMEENMQEVGIKENKMALVFIINLMEKSIMDYGKKVLGKNGYKMKKYNN